ncbi:MAG: MBOAT family O-acyltransferase [Algibacter sp.]
MLFNSIDFVVFFPVIFVLYWLLNNRALKFQNLLIVVASYIFYGWWDWRFLFLIFLSTVIDFFIGLKLFKEDNLRRRKILLWLSVIANLGLLGIFKYYNFFLENFISAFLFFGAKIEVRSLNIILPVGISFYTFQTLSYSIDIYKRKFKATKNFIAFSAFVSFFPQLVAGPIERATNLLPQFLSNRKFSYNNAVDGMRQILWGLFKKVVIADNCAKYANIIFNNSDDYNGSTLVLGALFFTFQIYGDFSGYSDIAIGTARLFGFNLKKNFAFPYFSRDIAEFWRRWHISLSTWFRDYLYIPLGGSRGNTWIGIRNVLVIFIISGLWHGANWTFIIWGILNALYFLPLLILKKNRKNLNTVASGKFLPSLVEIFKMLLTFVLTVIAWVFFRAKNVSHAWNYLSEIFSISLFEIPSIKQGISNSFFIILLVIIFMFIEWIGRVYSHTLEHLELRITKPFRWGFYTFLAFLIFFYSGEESQNFIYFQF